MRSQKVLAELKKHLQCILESIHRFHHAHDPETLHNFRLEVKKTRAALRLLMAGAPTARLPRLIREFYHLAGTCRDLQLLQQLISTAAKDLSVDPPEAYMKRLEVQKQNQVLLLVAKSRSANVQTGDIYRSILQKIKKANAATKTNQWWLHQQSRLAAMRSLTDSDIQLHEIRKKTKDILYNWKYRQKDTDPPFSLKKKHLTELTVKLGQHQDGCFAVQKITADLKTIKDPHEKKALEKIQAHLRSQNQSSANHCRNLIAQLKTENPLTLT